ncbi:hypothetical protein LDDCCGHA_0704 [Methylobacterium oxalidis]|nr:hypothetical protein LDDCCGHA_0704 [Methylobacterium oxalidis]
MLHDDQSALTDQHRLGQGGKTCDAQVSLFVFDKFSAILLFRLEPIQDFEPQHMHHAIRQR